MGVTHTTEDDLVRIFGADSYGRTAVERARTSRKRYVRSQVQLAGDSEAAKGVRLLAEEALDAFGIDALREVAEEGAAALIWKPDEPAATLKSRRAELGLPVERLARECSVSADLVRTAETPGQVVPIRDLQRLAQALALNETVIGYEPKARGDQVLGVRLRELTRARDETRFTVGVVLKLAEAAWVIARQDWLARLVGARAFEALAAPDPNFGYPAWRHGYRLAERTRNLLGLSSDEPIGSLRLLIEDRLGIPVVQQALGQRFAGATLANGGTRGIVVNEEGMNENVWVRRMTMGHELGHLLWDPDQQLNRLNVDAYEDLDRPYYEGCVAESS